MLRLVLGLGFIIAATTALADTRPVDLPKGCLGVRFPCAVTHQKSGVWSWQNVDYSVSKDTSIVLLAGNSLQLIAGDLWVEKSKNLKLKHGIFEMVANGDVMLNRRGKMLQVINLDGQVQVTKSGIKNDTIPAGFSNWYEGLGQSGDFQQGVVAPWSTNDLSLLFKRLPASSDSLKNRISSYKRNRKNAVKEGSQLYSKVTELRRIASETQEAQRSARIRQDRQEKEKIRKLYREKYFNP